MTLLRGATVKETKTLGTINEVLFILTLIVVIGVPLLLIFGFAYYDQALVILMVGVLFALLVYVQKLVVSIFINNSNNLAAIKDMLEKK